VVGAVVRTSVSYRVVGVAVVTVVLVDVTDGGVHVGGVGGVVGVGVAIVMGDAAVGAVAGV